MNVNLNLYLYAQLYLRLMIEFGGDFDDGMGRREDGDGAKMILRFDW